MEKKKLYKAMAAALGGGALLAGGVGSASAATTMYNMYNSQATSCNTSSGWVCGGAAGGGTDGWVWGGIGVPPLPSGANPGFVGINGSSTVSSSTPFGYNGKAPVMWAVDMTANDSAQISIADAFSRYGKHVDIDTAKGAWLDPAANFGWKHDLDVGLFRTDTTSQVTLSASALNLGGNFGFTILTGMAPGSNAAYSHHGAWNNTHDGTPLPQTIPGTIDYGDGTGTIVATTDAITGTNVDTITFTAQANQIYTILLGGYKNGSWTVTNDSYVLDITTSAVPLPAAAWLFAPAIAGLFGFGRRKTRAAMA